MDGRMSHFSYLTEEVGESFFQKAAEEIAKEAANPTTRQILAAVRRRKPLKTKPPTDKQKQFIREMEGLTERGKKSSEAVEKAIREASKGGYGHGGRPAKLAMLCFKSNEAGLQKEASQALWDPDDHKYNSFMSKIASASPMASLGISMAAVEHLTQLEKIGCDVDELGSHVLEDALRADIYMETCFAKLAGVEAPFEEIAAELEADILEDLGFEKGARVGWLGRAWQAIRQPARLTRARAALQKLKAGPRADVAAYRKWRTGRLAKKHKAITKPIEKLKAQRAAIQARLKVPMLTPGHRASLVTKAQGLTKDIRALVPAQRAAGRKMTAMQRRLGLHRMKEVPGGGPKYRASVEKARRAAGTASEKAKAEAAAAAKAGKTEAAGAAEKARETARATTEAGERLQYGRLKPVPGAKKRLGRKLTKEELKKAKHGTYDVETGRKIEPMGGRVDTSAAERAAAETARRMEAAGAGPGGRVMTQAERQAAEASAKARGVSEAEFERLRSGQAGIPPVSKPTAAPPPTAPAPKGTAPGGGQATTGAPKPKGKGKRKGNGEAAKGPGDRPPVEAVEGKGMGVMDAWTKWGKEGWGALSPQEKARLVRAGVAGAGGLVAYKTVFAD